VTHLGDEISLETENGNTTLIPFHAYKQEVISFVDRIEDFYKSSSPKNLPVNRYDRDGYLKFWNEWHVRRNKWN
jgi:hypothetical protein